MKRIATTLLVASLVATPMLVLPPAAQADVSIGIGVSVGFPPPVLPVYAQPIAPGPGYIWTPGYWAWDPAYGYYWVPGTWVMPPEIGLLWTPGWWGWSAGFYRWNPGYWGTRVGFYGGVNYGYGYFGSGYSGGYWRGGDFYYNRAVNNVNITNIRNVYVDKTVINNVNVNRVSYNGGRGGIAAQPTAAQRAYGNQRRFQPTSVQTRQREMAMRDPAQRFKTNQGRPAVFATQRAGNFQGPHTVRAPAAANSRMVAPPERGRAPANTPNRGMMQAPERGRAPANAPNRGMMQAPERGRAPANAPNRGMMEAPRERAQPTRPSNEQFRNERAAPAREPQYAEPGSARPRGQSIERQSRGEQAAPRRPPQARGNRGEKQPPKSSDGGH